LRHVVLMETVERSSAVTMPADHRLLLSQRDAVPELHEHTDDANDLIRAPDRPCRLGSAGLDPHEAVHLGRRGNIGVGRSIPETEEVAGAALRAGLAGEAVKLPSRLHGAARMAGDVA